MKWLQSRALASTVELPASFPEASSLSVLSTCSALQAGCKDGAPFPLSRKLLLVLFHHNNIFLLPYLHTRFSRATPVSLKFIQVNKDNLLNVMYNLIYQSFLNEVLDPWTVKITNQYIHDFRNSVLLLLA